MSWDDIGDLDLGEPDTDLYTYGDYDPFDTRKESCDCGHTRSAHVNGACRRETTTTDYDALPPAEYAPGEEDHPFARPINWPMPSGMPTKTIPCPCKGFSYPEQDPSDYDH